MAVSILALGLSAGMAVVTYVNAFFQPFPGVDDADRLVRVFGAESDDAYQNISYLDFLDYAASQRAARPGRVGWQRTEARVRGPRRGASLLPRHRAPGGH